MTLLVRAAMPRWSCSPSPEVAARSPGLLISSHGCAAGRDLGLRPPTDYYIKLDEPCSFELISELCRLRGETALGYIATDDGNVQLNPLAKASRVFDKDDRIIVLARG